jgi:hypothetical protein
MSIHEIAQRFFQWSASSVAAIFDYPVDWAGVFQWCFALAIAWLAIWAVVRFIARYKTVSKQRAALSKIDPAEVVTFDDNLKMPLRSAVAKIREMRPRERSSIKIYRQGKPPLDGEQISYILTLPIFKN